MIETVQVQSDLLEQGWILINAADFVEGVHELWEAEPTEPKKPRSSRKATPAPTPTPPEGEAE